MHDEGDAHGAVAEPVRDVGLHGADVEQRAACHARHGIGIDHPHVGRADRAPLQPRGVGTPRVILRPGFRRDTQGAQPLHAVAKGTGVALKNIEKFNFLIR